ncbi:hypothetical protein PHLCEN_2v1222 [Hermanssonia centrifuga]|uniref:Uncharacterized protein n=1 Tax=Hermanssonia centrifuga TaxID=98765 RepID=A0A2R6S3S5_9APHY|nr:hypothetical protein PHLCEN_2v1222 [Hermanssonia centrifuga]
MSIHLDPLWDYFLISPDTLSVCKLSTLAIHQKEEISEEVGEGWEVVKVLLRPLSISMNGQALRWSSTWLDKSAMKAVSYRLGIHLTGIHELTYFSISSGNLMILLHGFNGRRTSKNCTLR